MVNIASKTTSISDLQAHTSLMSGDLLIEVHKIIHDLVLNYDGEELFESANQLHDELGDESSDDDDEEEYDNIGKRYHAMESYSDSDEY